MSAPSPPTEAEKMAIVAGFAKFFEPTSERGAALSAVSDLDAQMGACLRTAMIKDENAVNNMFGEQGSLNAFGAKVRFSYLLGLIDAETYSELLIINKIRNAFAHALGANSFSYPKIQGWTSSLKILNAPLGILRYLTFANRIEFPVPDEMAWSIFKHRFSLNHIDLTQPNWAFVFEVSVFTGCFRRTVEDNMHNLQPTAPLF